MKCEMQKYFIWLRDNKDGYNDNEYLKIKVNLDSNTLL